MLDTLERLPADSILGLSAACRADPNPDKVDLTVGIYMDEQGNCPVFEAVREAQRALVAEETTKAYMPPEGDDAFKLGMHRRVLGGDRGALGDGRGSVCSRPANPCCVAPVRGPAAVAVSAASTGRSDAPTTA